MTLGRGPGLGSIALLAALLAAAGCGDRVEVVPEPPTAGPAAGSPPPIVLVTIDTLRADHVSAYGYERETTPHLDALAAEGVSIEDTPDGPRWRRA